MNATNSEEVITGLPEAVSDIEAGLGNLRRHGVNIHRGYIDAEMVDRLKQRVSEQAAMERQLGVANIGGAGGPEELLACPPGDIAAHVYQIVDFLPNKGRVFLDLMMNPLGLAYAEGLFAELPFRLWSSGAVISTRGLARQRPHSDEGAIPSAMCVIPTLLNVFICLTDFEEEMGATMVSPGTHKLGGRPWEVADSETYPYYPAIAKAGDAIMWDGRTWHGGGEHRSDKTRYVITNGFSLAGVTPQHLYAACLHDDVYDTLSQAELEVLGFRAEGAGYTNRIAPRHAGDPRTNTTRRTPFIPELHPDDEVHSIEA